MGSLVLASGASLAANVAVAHPVVVCRVIAAWPSFALIDAYEILRGPRRHRCAVATITGEMSAGVGLAHGQVTRFLITAHKMMIQLRTGLAGRAADEPICRVRELLAFRENH